MNSLYPGEENIIICDNYSIFLKQISEDFIKYITNYKIATSDYLKKIELNQEKYSPKLLEGNDQLKNININHIISLTSIIPKVIEQQIINIEYFVKGIDSKFEKFEKQLKDKNIEFLVCQNDLKEAEKESKEREDEKEEEISDDYINTEENQKYIFFDGILYLEDELDFSEMINLDYARRNFLLMKNQNSRYLKFLSSYLS